MPKKNLFMGFVFFVGVSVLAGCSSTHDATPFLQYPEKMHEGVYFKEEYVVPGARFNGYHRLIVEDVSLVHLKDRSDHDLLEITELADVFKEALKETLSQRFTIVDRTDRVEPGTLILQPALTEIKTPMRLLNLATTVIIGPLTAGSTSFELRVLDDASGELLAEFAEKQTAGKNVASLTVGSYMKYTHAKAAFQEWSEELLELLQTN